MQRRSNLVFDDGENQDCFGAALLAMTSLASEMRPPLQEPALSLPKAQGGGGVAQGHRWPWAIGMGSGSANLRWLNLNPRNHPSAFVIFRVFHHMPHFVERLGAGMLIFADKAGEAHAGDFAIAFFDDF